MPSMFAVTESGQTVSLSQEELQQALISYSTSILDQWGKGIPTERFILDDSGEPFMLVAPEEAVQLVGLALIMAPDIIERVFAKAARNDQTSKPKCGG